MDVWSVGNTTTAKLRLPLRAIWVVDGKIARVAF